VLELLGPVPLVVRVDLVAEGLGMEGVEFGITDVAAPLERDGHVDDASEMLGGGALPR